MARCALGLRPAQDIVQPLEALVRQGGFTRILSELAGQGEDASTLAIDATHLKAHRTAASLRLKKGGKQTG